MILAYDQITLARVDDGESGADGTSFAWNILSNSNVEKTTTAYKIASYNVADGREVVIGNKYTVVFKCKIPAGNYVTLYIGSTMLSEEKFAGTGEEEIYTAQVTAVQGNTTGWEQYVWFYHSNGGATNNNNADEATMYWACLYDGHITPPEVWCPAESEIYGADGADGTSVTIASKAVTYQLSDSGVTTPTGTWSGSVPTLTQGKYLWTRTVVAYSTGDSTTSYSVSYIAVDGQDGAAGADGVGISSTAVTYQAGASQTAVPTGTWSASVPTLSASLPYLWTRTALTYSDGTTSAAYSVSSTLDSVEVGGRNLASFSTILHYGSGAFTRDGYVYTISSLGTGNGIYFLSSLFEVGKAYCLSYKFQKTNGGTLTAIGGHCSGFTTKSFMVDGNKSSSAYITGYALSDDTDIHTVTAILVFNGSASNNNLYIQPNRENYNSASMACKFWDIMLEQSNIPSNWTPAPEDTETAIEEVAKDVETVTAIANGKSTAYYADSAPSATSFDLCVNDIWFDTDGDYAMYMWDGTAWELCQFSTGALAASCVTANLIASSAVTAAKIASGAVTTVKLAANAVTAAKIAAGTITTTQIAANTITGDNIAAATITATNIAADTITGSLIAADTITADNIVAGTITATELAASSVTTDKLAALSVTAAKIAAGAITADKIEAGAVTAEKISVSDLSALSATIGGFTIGSTSIYSGADAFGTTSGNIYIGSLGISLGTTFKVTAAGALTATSGTIGGWTIGSSALYNGTASMTSTTAGTYIGADGIASNDGSGNQVSIANGMFCTTYYDDMNDATYKITLGDTGGGLYISSESGDVLAHLTSDSLLTGTGRFAGDLSVEGTADFGDTITSGGKLWANDAIISGGHSTAIGSYLSASNSSDVSLASGTATAVASISLPAGSWVVIGSARFSANTSGYRRANLSATSGSTDVNVGMAPCPSGVTNIQVVREFVVTSPTTYYLNLAQNSGSTLTCGSGLGLITAMRIA
uniref:Uncharacterized protein n=1 Tax=uncultured bacterium scaffold00056 TaxID=1132475 RepID=I6ZMF0_9BACT|nr:conserved hypothetical protein [uncultured bacterium scaffold00056]